MRFRLSVSWPKARRIKLLDLFPCHNLSRSCAARRRLEVQRVRIVRARHQANRPANETRKERLCDQVLPTIPLLLPMIIRLLGAKAGEEVSCCQWDRAAPELAPTHSVFHVQGG